MSFLQLTPNPRRNPDQPEEAAAETAQSTSGAAPPPRPGDLKPLQSSTTDQPGSNPLNGAQPVKIRSSRFGELEEHELIHLIDALDDERSRARFRESIYISVLVWVVVAWFLFYGPRILFHQPVLRDPMDVLKERDKQQQLTYLNQPPAPVHRPPVLNQKTIQQIRKQVQAAPRPQPTPPAPAPPQQQAPPPQEQAHTNTAPPVPQPPIPLPSAPKASPPADLPSAPRPTIASNSQSVHNALQDAMRGALNSHGGGEVGSSPSAGGPLQAGAQILSDIGDWDPSLYMRRLHNDIQRNWDPLIPAEVEPPLSKRGVVGIRFIILRDGQIGDIKLETASGDVALDRAAWNAITSEGQFPQLPKEFRGQQLELRVGFFYNTPVR